MEDFFNTSYQKNIQPKEPKIERFVQEIENVEFSEEEMEEFHPLPDSISSEDDLLLDFPSPLKILKECIQEKLAIKALAASFKQKTSQILTLLSPREERIIRMRFAMGMSSDHTWEEIAQRFSITKERTKQIADQALKKLKYWS